MSDVLDLWAQVSDEEEHALNYDDRIFEVPLRFANNAPVPVHTVETRDLLARWNPSRVDPDPYEVVCHCPSVEEIEVVLNDTSTVAVQRSIIDEWFQEGGFLLWSR